jgi:hypothetical protein
VEGYQQPKALDLAAHYARDIQPLQGDRKVISSRQEALLAGY